MDFLELLEQRKEAYKKTWQKLSKRDKFLFVLLITLGIVQIIGGVIICYYSKSLC